MYRNPLAKGAAIYVEDETIVVVLGPCVTYDHVVHQDNNLVSVPRTVTPLLAPAGILYLVANATLEQVEKYYFKEV